MAKKYTKCDHFFYIYFVLLQVYFTVFLPPLPVGVDINVPLVLFGAHDEVLGALLQAESISAASMRHEKPLLSHFDSRLHTWMVG